MAKRCRLWGRHISELKLKYIKVYQNRLNIKKLSLSSGEALFVEIQPENLNYAGCQNWRPF